MFDVTTDKYANICLDAKTTTVPFSNGTLSFSIQIVFLEELTMQAKQVTCTSVIRFKLQENNVVFYGYIREMAPGQTKLSIFNVLMYVRLCVCVCMCVEGGMRWRQVKLFSLSLFHCLSSSLMNYQCFEVISMQRPDSKLGSQTYPCRHAKPAFSDTEFNRFPLCGSSEHEHAS